MPELQPILLLPFENDEFRRKKGGGKTSPPLVEVTEEFRLGLTSALVKLAKSADDIGASESSPLAVKVVLHERALAKSNRPYAFLDSVDLHAESVAKLGELIIPATGPKLRSLATRISNAKSNADIFSVSTLAEISAWSQRDMFAVQTIDEADKLIASAKASRTPLKITLFPWATEMRTEEHLVRASPGDRRQVTESAAGISESSIAHYVSSTADVDIVAGTVGTSRPILYVLPRSTTTANTLASLAAVRTVSLADHYRSGVDSKPQFYAPVRAFTNSDLQTLNPESPIVGVLDTGVSSNHLEPWVAERVNYDVPSETDSGHGTFTAGLIVDSRGLNGGDTRFPSDSARLLDAQVMPRTGISEAYLHERVIEVVTDPRNAAVKVWNCSFGSEKLDPESYGTFAQELDSLSSRLGVLFVVAAGNYQLAPARGWPPADGVVYDDRIMSPSESITSITVGARAHKGGLVDEGRPASYTRRGPNFASHVKPEVCHWSGDLAPDGTLKGHGVRSLVPSGELAESVGTSFAAPIVSTTAATTWRMLEQSGAVETVSPELVKGLVIHASALADASTEAGFRDYYGWGVPPSAMQVLGNETNSFTTVHEVEMIPGSNWFKEPFPMPDCLLTAEGKFRGEVVLTVAYAPPIDPAFGPEAVRYEIEGALGHVTRFGEDRAVFESITPGEHPSDDLREKSQIAEGKWSPVKTYRKRYPQGVKGGTNWALRLSLTERVSEEIGRSQRVYAIVTLRDLGADLPVYVDGLQAISRLRYTSKQLVSPNEIRLRSNP